MRRRGSLLLETAIAVGLVAVALIAVAQLLAVAAQQERVIGQRRQATQEAANILEQILARPWNDIASERLQALSLPAESQRRLPEGKLICEVDVSELPKSKRISAEVSWQNRAGDRESVRLFAWRFQSESKP